MSNFELLRAERQLGQIEIGVVDAESLRVVRASAGFYVWVNRPAGASPSLVDICRGVSAEAIRDSLSRERGVCECEGAIKGSDGRVRIIRFRFMRDANLEGAHIRMIAFDRSEIARGSGIRDEIPESRRNLEALINSLPQAVFSINCDLRVVSESSPKMMSLFEECVTGKHIQEFTSLTDRDIEPLRMAFSGTDWDLVVEILPREFQSGQGRFGVVFAPFIEHGSLASVIMIVDEVAALRPDNAKPLQPDPENRALVAVLSAKDEFFDLVWLARHAANQVENFTELRMLTHSLKGGFSSLDCDELAMVCEEAEKRWATSGYTEAWGLDFVVSLNRGIDAFISRNQEVLQASAGALSSAHHRNVTLDYDALGAVFHTIENCRVSSETLRAIEQLVEAPVSEALGWLDKVWQKTLAREGKAGNPIRWVGDARIARQPYTGLFQSFVHIIRNAADHGIEDSMVRQRHGKGEVANFEIGAQFRDGLYTITFKDDGAGIDPERVAAIARERGIVIPEDMPRNRVFNLLFDAGFSTKERVGELSGRGIGLDAVKHQAQAAGGDVSIESEMGAGTLITVWFPRVPYW